MADPTFLAYNGVSAELLEPSYKRMRHRFRGPRESYKLNLDNHQFLYDVERLLSKMEVVESNGIDNLDTTYGGGEIVDEEVIGVTDMINRLDGLLRRVNRIFASEGVHPGLNIYPSNSLYPSESGSTPSLYPNSNLYLSDSLYPN